MKKIAVLIIIVALLSGMTLVAQANAETYSPTVWFKPETLTEYNDGDQVVTWVDSTGNGWDAAQRLNTSVPTPKVKKNGLNGYAVLRYDGGQNLTFSNESVGANQQYTAIIVARSTGTSTSMFLRTHNGKCFGLSYVNGHGASVTAGGWHPLVAENSASAGESEPFHIMVATWDIQSGELKYYHDGVLAATKTVTYTPAAADALNQVHMGGDWSKTGNYLTGEIAEVMVYSDVLPALELDKVGVALAEKYDLSWTRLTTDPLGPPEEELPQSPSTGSALLGSFVLLALGIAVPLTVSSKKKIF